MTFSLWKSDGEKLNLVLGVSPTGLGDNHCPPKPLYYHDLQYLKVDANSLVIFKASHLFLSMESHHGISKTLDVSPDS